MPSNASPDPTNSPTGPAPVFILGMLPRSGTNHFADLFALHPDVHVMKPIFEDHLLRNSWHLDAYVRDVSAAWTPGWGVPSSEPAALRRALGGGILDWLQGHAAEGQTVVTKMPSLEESHRFFELFEDATLVVLVRDGRSLCESGARSFSHPLEHWFRRYDRAGRKVLALQRRFASKDRFAVVRYEDLVDDRAAVMQRVCAIAGLDPDRFPVEKVAALPVRGSSELSSAGKDLHWKPTEATDDFDPRQRWNDWDAATHLRFATVAGATHERLGYSLIDAGPVGRAALLSTIPGRAKARAVEAKTRASRTVRAALRVPPRI